MSGVRRPVLCLCLHGVSVCVCDSLGCGVSSGGGGCPGVGGPGSVSLSSGFVSSGPGEIAGAGLSESSSKPCRDGTQSDEIERSVVGRSR